MRVNPAASVHCFENVITAYPLQAPPYSDCLWLLDPLHHYGCPRYRYGIRQPELPIAIPMVWQPTAAYVSLNPLQTPYGCLRQPSP